MCSKQASVTCCLLCLLLLSFAFCLVIVFFHVLLLSLLAQCCMETHLLQVCPACVLVPSLSPCLHCLTALHSQKMPFAFEHAICTSGSVTLCPVHVCTIACSDIHSSAQECCLGHSEWQHSGRAPPASALCCCLPAAAALQPRRGVCECVHPAGVLPHSQ